MGFIKVVDTKNIKLPRFKLLKREEIRERDPHEHHRLTNIKYV